MSGACNSGCRAGRTGEAGSLQGRGQRKNSYAIEPVVCQQQNLSCLWLRESRTKVIRQNVDMPGVRNSSRSGWECLTKSEARWYRRTMREPGVCKGAKATAFSIPEKNRRTWRKPRGERRVDVGPIVEAGSHQSLSQWLLIRDARV